MKKCLMVVFILVMLFNTCIAESTDLTSLSYEELLVLKQSVDAELLVRAENPNPVLLPGTYEVGKDIQAGTFYILFDQAYDSFMTADVYIYKDRADFDVGYSAYSKSKVQFSVAVYTGGDSARIDLADGNMLAIEDGSIKISLVDFDDAIKGIEKIPENAKNVPEGIYIVGKDIAAGRFNGFVEGRNAAQIYIYTDEATYKADEKGYYPQTQYEIGIARGQGRQVTFVLEEGNVFIVKNGPLYMNKAESGMLTFD